jgi:SRSO17 transposase
MPPVDLSSSATILTLILHFPSAPNTGLRQKFKSMTHLFLSNHPKFVSRILHMPSKYWEGQSWKLFSLNEGGPQLFVSILKNTQKLY